MVFDVLEMSQKRKKKMALEENSMFMGNENEIVPKNLEHAGWRMTRVDLEIDVIAAPRSDKNKKWNVEDR